VELDIKGGRHYTASQLLAGGFDLRNTAARLGHSGGGATTLRHYADPIPEVDRRAAAYLAQLTARSTPSSVRSSPRAGRVASAGLLARGRPRGRIRPACPGSRPASASARRSRKLDLGVCAAQFVGGPSGQGVVNGRIQLSLSVVDRMVER
jgi:hypothetical protein